MSDATTVLLLVSKYFCASPHESSKMIKPVASIKFNILRLIGVFTFVFAVLLNAVHLQAITNDCGTINIPKGLSIEGNQTNKGFWPFAVAIYEIKDYKPFCGGTLISRKHVLTGEYTTNTLIVSSIDKDFQNISAAHCIQDENRTQTYGPSEIAVLLGAFVLLAKSEAGLKHANISEILVHPDWKMFSKTRPDADVAILVLENDVTLSNDIQIVCLPSDDDTIENAEGFVVGWDLVQQTPKHSIINVFNSSDCINEDLPLGSFLSPRTFCGGTGKISQSKRISGGGFFTSFGSAWVQHGIAVSITNATINNSTEQSVVSLMSVASFKNWIGNVVSQSEGVIGEAVKGKVNLECKFIRLYYGYVVNLMEGEECTTAAYFNFSYTCVAYGLNVDNKNVVVNKLVGAHKSEGSNNNVELIQYHNGTMLYLLDGIGKLFPNLKSVFVGYSDSISLHTVLIRRSNFQHMANVFEIAIHKSSIETVADDVFWDLPQLERFQLDGKLKELPERIFEKNVKLQEVYLASNALVFLPRKLFRKNLDLKWVNFEGNFLKFIEVDFMLLPDIKYVFLAGNICVNRNLNKTEENIEDQYEAQNETDDSLPVKRVIELQRLIYSNCTFFT